MELAPIPVTHEPKPVETTDKKAESISNQPVKLALIALASSVLVGVLSLGSQWIAIYGQRAAADKAETVAETLAVKTVVTDAKLEQIHVLVNSDMGKQKQKTAEALWKIARLTNNADDLALARDAQLEYEKHISRQNASETTFPEDKQPGPPKIK